MSDFRWLDFTPRGSYIDGDWRIPANPEGAIRDVNPGDPNDVVGEFPWRADQIDEAVAAARRAFPAWSRMPFEERAAVLRRFAERVKANQERLAHAISRDMGKVLWEARGEAKAVAEKVAITLDDGMRLVDDLRPPGVKGLVRYRPRGVLAVIGPFNFPAHLPNGHIVPALATGNTVVFKPASHTPAVGQVMAECLDEAGVPPGVFNMLQVPGRLCDRLVLDREVDGVLFTGSTEVGQRIERLSLDIPGRLCALEMGGKNATIVLDDAPFEKAVYEVLTSAFLTSGQRCTATSRVVCTAGIADRFADALAEATRALHAGAQHDPRAFMGPLADRGAAEDFDRWQAIAKSEGAECVVPGGLDPEPAVRGGAYVRPSVHRVARPDPESRYQTEELFAPDTCLYTVRDLDEAIALADATDYGLACSVFTADEPSWLEVTHRVRAGVINWNRGTVGANSRLPFGGLKRSGNGHPAALFSTLYCTYPVASLEEGPELDRTSILPGVTLPF